MNPRLLRALATAAALVLALPAAQADEPLWEAGIGAGWLRLPHYRGSSESHTWLLPVPYFVYRGDFLRADKDGARAMIFDGDRVDFDLSVGGSPPTKSNDSQARAGMPDLAPTFEIGPKMNVRLAQGAGWKLDLRVPVRAVVAVDDGLRVAGFNVEPVINIDSEAGGFNIGAQAGPLWGDRRLHDAFYSVAPEFATATRPAYTARGGYAGWQATAGVSRRVGRLWMGAFVRHDSVAGAAFAGSPLVTARSHTALGVAMSSVFAVSDARVADSR